MGVGNLNNKAIDTIKRIIKEIDNERKELFNYYKFYIDKDKCIGLILRLFKNFYGNKINDYVYMGLFNDNMVCDEIIKMLFKMDMMLDLSSDGNIMWCDYNKKFLYTDGIDNYIYLGDISIKFNNDYLDIMYGKYFKTSLRFDEDGIINERKIEREIASMKVDNTDGYRCRSIITISRNYIDPFYVVICDRMEISNGNRIINMYDRKCAGYIDSLYVYDLRDVSNLGGGSCDRSVSDNWLIDKFFPNIKMALVDRLNKKDKFLVKKYKNSR